MAETLEHHLNAVATRMGGFLRGFDDPRIHVGSAARFALEFRKIMDLPALSWSGGAGAISYSVASTRRRICSVETGAAEPRDPVSTMISGLRTISLSASGARDPLPLETLRPDLHSLLRVPGMLFYVAVRDRAAFFSGLRRIAQDGGMALILQEGSAGENAILCPQCGLNLFPVRQPQTAFCGSCRRSFEFVRSLPLVPGASALVSYEMLRAMVALDPVESYQEEGEIVPLKPGREIL